MVHGDSKSDFGFVKKLKRPPKIPKVPKPSQIGLKSIFVSTDPPPSCGHGDSKYDFRIFKI